MMKPLAARGNDLELDLRVLGQQPQQLHAGVTGTADDAGLDHNNSRGFVLQEILQASIKAICARGAVHVKPARYRDGRDTQL